MRTNNFGMKSQGVLSDVDIKSEATKIGADTLTIDPLQDDHVQPASYDLTLGNEWIVPVEAHPDDRPIRPDEGLPQNAKRTFDADTFVINPMQDQRSAVGTAHDSAPFVLGHVEETISIPSYMTAEVKGRSSIGRLGVIPHTAGWGDPGFEGQLTLEFVNLSPNPILLESGMRIAQAVFSYTRTPASEPYGQKDDSKYQGQSGVTESRIEEDQ